MLHWAWFDNFITFATSEQGSALGSFLGGTAAIVGVLGATIGGYLGFDAWRRELRGATRFHAARELLRATIGVRNAIRDARTPWYRDWVADQGRTVGPGVSKSVIAEWLREAYEVRLQKVTEAVRRLADAEADAEVFWKEDVGPLVGAIYKVVNDLSDTASVFWKVEISKSRDPAAPGDPPRKIDPGHKEMRDIVYQTTKDDSLEKGLVDAVSAMHDWCDGKLR